MEVKKNRSKCIVFVLHDFLFFHFGALLSIRPSIPQPLKIQVNCGSNSWQKHAQTELDGAL